MKGTKGQGKTRSTSAKSPEDQAKQKKSEVEKAEVANWRKPKEDKKVRFNEEETGQESRKELPFKDVPPVEFSDRNKEHDTVAEIASDVAYRLRAPIDEIKDASVKAIVETIKSVIVGVPLKDLIAAAPGVQKETKSLVSKKRVPVQSKESVHLQGNFKDKDDMTEDECLLPGNIYAPEGQYIQADAIHTREIPMVRTFYVAEEQDGLVPKGAIVAYDPVLQYLSTLGENEAPRQIFTHMVDPVKGTDSAPLRVVYPLIQGHGQAEAILDGGSQIVSMALATAIELGLTWDPDINIFMQSANGQTEKTVGLARNVAFRFGDITLYLQVHVLRNPAYTVLLGRPFDILTASNVQNQRDGGQILTLTDPVTRKRCTLPTFERGVLKHLQKVRPSVVEDPEDSVKMANGNFQVHSRN